MSAKENCFSKYNALLVILVTDAKGKAEKYLSDASAAASVRLLAAPPTNVKTTTTYSITITSSMHAGITAGC